MLRGSAWKSGDPIGTVFDGTFEIRMRRLSTAHCPMKPSPRDISAG